MSRLMTHVRNIDYYNHMISKLLVDLNDNPSLTSVISIYKQKLFRHMYDRDGELSWLFAIDYQHNVFQYSIDTLITKDTLIQEDTYV